MSTIRAGLVRPYADHTDDGIVQLSFTLPVQDSARATRAAIELCRCIGMVNPDIAHQQALVDGYTYFVIYARCVEGVEIPEQDEAGEFDYMSRQQVDDLLAGLGRPVRVIGAGTGTDTHSLGIDAMLNLKGFHGEPGLEAYKSFDVINLGSQVPNERLLALAVERDADAILVSQTVSQQNLHVQNLTQLVDMVEAEGLRDRLLLVCGGPRISPELARELGFDQGFSTGTYPNHLASYLATEIMRRRGTP